MQTTKEFWSNRPWKSSNFDNTRTEDILSSVRDIARSGQILSAKGIDPADYFRIAAGAASLELSRRGVAPRWQGLVECKWRDVFGHAAFGDSKPFRDKILKIVETDSALYDLIWLREQFAGKTRVCAKWAKLFERSPSVPLSYDPWVKEVMLDILDQVAEGNVSRPKLMASLGIRQWEQFGCLELIERSVKSIPDLAGANIKRWVAARIKRITRMTDDGKRKTAENQGILKFAQTALLLPNALGEAKRHAEALQEALERCIDTAELWEATESHREAVEAVEWLQAGCVRDDARFDKHKAAGVLQGWVAGGKAMDSGNVQRTIERWRR